MSRQLSKYLHPLIILPAALLLPSVILSALAVIVIAAGDRFSPGYIERLIPSSFIYAAACSALSVLLSVINLLRRDNNNSDIIKRGKIVSVILIPANIAYTGFVFLFIELSKLGNIPVGRD